MNEMVVYSAATDSITDSLSSLAGQVTGAIGEIAPIAVSIMGVFLIWRLGTKFFKNFAKA